MTSKLRWLVLALCATAIASLGGAVGAPASTATHCNTPSPSGRLFCVTVEDSDGVSPSGVAGAGKPQTSVLAYQFYKLTIANDGGSTLTNGTMRVVLSDIVTGGSTNSSATYVPSASTQSCSATASSPNTVTCPLANVPAGTSAPTIVLAYRTSTTPGVTATTATVTTGFKEGANGANGANPATTSFTETTSLEPDPESSLTWSPSGQTVRMSTSPAYDAQFTGLEYRVPATKPSFNARVAESSGYVCAPGVTCFGELITTDLSAAAAGTFTTSDVFHLTTTMSLDVVPGGNTAGIVMSHRLDTGAFEVVSRRCSSTPPASGEALPCLTVAKDKKAKLLTVDVWGFQNGGWMTGG